MSLLKQNDNDTQTMIDELKVEVDADRISNCGHLLKKKPPRPINLFEADLAYYTVIINGMTFTIKKPYNIKCGYNLEGVYDNFINTVKDMREKYKNNIPNEIFNRFFERGITNENSDNNNGISNTTYNNNCTCFGSNNLNNNCLSKQDRPFYDLLKMDIRRKEFFSNIKIHYKMLPGNGVNLHRQFKTKLIEQQLYDFKEQWNYYIECLASQYKPEVLYQNRHIKFNEAKRAQWIYDACHGKKPEVIEIIDDNEEVPKIVQETVVDQKIRRENFLNDSYEFSKSPLFSQKIFN